MKKRYISKAEMARVLATKRGIQYDTARSLLSRNPKPETEVQRVKIDGEVHELRFYLTPKKYL